MQHTDFNRFSWNKADYTDLQQHLKEIADPNYRAFHQRLVPNVENLLGVRTPVLRELAKEIAKGDPFSYFPLVTQQYYEETMLYGILLGMIKTELPILFRELDRFVPMIDNWAVCDTACAGLKIAKKHPEEMFRYLEKFLNSDREYELRFGIVMLMDHFLDDAHIDQVLSRYGAIRHEGYYVKMAIAWGLSFCLIQYRDKTLRFLETAEIDNFTYQKALQKGIESNRISAADKALFRSMKRKKFLDSRPKA